MRVASFFRKRHTTYHFAVLAVTLATLIQIALERRSGQSNSFNLYYFALFFTAALGEFRPTLLVVVLGSLFGWLFALLPDFAFSALILFRWVMFLLVAALALYLNRNNSRSRQRLQAQTAALEAALTEAEAERRRLHAVLEALPAAVMIADAEGRIVQSNAVVNRIFAGSTPLAEKIDDYGVYQGWWAESGEPVQPEDWGLARALQKGETSTNEVIHIQRLDGTRGTILNSAAPIRDSSYNIVGAVVIFQDITALRRIEEALRESEIRYAALAESTFDAIVIHDLGYIIDVNHSFETLFQVRREDIIGEHFMLRFVSDEFRERALMQMRLRQEEPFEAILLRSDGTRFEGEIRPRNAIYKGASVRIVSIHDITIYRRAQATALKLAEEEVRVAAIAGFVRDISHDFRTPLSVIGTSAYLLERQPDPAKRAQAAERIQHQMHVLERLLDGLLHMSQIDSHKDFVFAPGNVCDVLAMVTAQAQKQAASAGVRLVLELPECPLPALFDESDLRRALLEIVMNGIQFTPEGGSVTVRAHQQPDTVRIQVEDTGIGIPQAEHALIFQRLYRVDKARQSTNGSVGLGLSIARTIIDAHHGRIEVHSNGQKGSLFEIFLPSLPAS